MRLNNWVALVVFALALVYFLRVKGPQEHVRLEEDGRLTLVTADGTPIEGRVSGTSSTASTKDTPGSTKDARDSVPEPDDQPADAEKK
jgi:hypothetical protein